MRRAEIPREGEMSNLLAERYVFASNKKNKIYISYVSDFNWLDLEISYITLYIKVLFVEEGGTNPPMYSCDTSLHLYS